MQSIEVTGKTVDEAIQSGLSTLGLTRDQVEVQVVDEGARGFFGIGMRHARVRLNAICLGECECGGNCGHDFEKDSSSLVRSWLGLDDSEDDGDIDHAEPTEEGDSRPSPSPSADNERSEGLVYLRGLVEQMGLDAEITERESDDVTVLDVEGRALGVMIGRHGETLDAIQYLVNLAANKQSHIDGDGRRVRYVVDVAGYRRKREENLVELAMSVARKVRADGKSQALEAMSALERRVVHMALKDVEGVTTHSEGREPYRRIVISSSDVDQE